jgi:hypothetical protein
MNKVVDPASIKHLQVRKRPAGRAAAIMIVAFLSSTIIFL